MSDDNILNIAGSGRDIIMDDVATHVFPVNMYAAQSLHGYSTLHVNESKSTGSQHKDSHVTDTVNNARVLHAIQVMSNQGKRKRGPKEKDTFQRFVYCLPERYGKLPKFTSFDQNEKAIIKAHQKAGYGYPAQDYIDGIAQKTHICLSYNAEQFMEFIRTLFSKLVNRKWDMYKIDKQRRLLRVEQDTPRGIKDMKYQGYLLIIPYDNDNDRPQSVIYRTGEDYIIQVSTNHTDHSTFDETDTGCTTPINHCSLELQEVIKPPHVDVKSSPVASPSRLTSQMSSAMMSTTSQNTMRMPIVSSCHSIRNENECDVAVKIEQEELCHKTHELPQPASQQPERRLTSPVIQSNVNTSMAFIAKSKLVVIAETYRGLLQNPLSVTIRKDHLVDDVIRLYRANPSFGNHHIRVFMNCDGYPSDQSNAIPAGTMFVMFWREVLHRFFQGNREYVPVVDLDMDEEFYVTIGRILYHGLVLFDYWPVRLAQACTAVILTEKCSDSQLTTSFYNVMSESEKKVVNEAKKEIRSNIAEFTLPVLRNLCRTLRFYGNVVKPQPCTFDDLILRLARYYLVRNSYWALSGISAGFISSFSGNLPVITEHDVFKLYARLSPNALTLFEKVNFIFSPTEHNTCIDMEEKRTKMYLEVAIMKMTTDQMARMLTRWCYFDCLCADQLYTRFHPQSVSEPPMFDPDTRTLNVSSVYSSQEEFTALLMSRLDESVDVTADVVIV
ncbi:uncharacterized protein LOC110462617 [Mizuhopecten yessoensis]|uniref:Uncharacterized protein n=1 Tax=Mizuhopecten yessoensis TaxID=6573 RepID=A0A210PXZ0_MIZYE|nr:uncharacterized protein LOC110462617 [Mizuhopecten yessoensis]OWF41343.1 hypothetical protein KP79_PYT07496 [Mizuhopecten yessoensis]